SSALPTPPSRFHGFAKCWRLSSEGTWIMKTHPSTKTLAKRCVALGMPALVMAGCMVGPDYKKPDTPVPGEFRSAQITPAEAVSFADMPWWSVFNDATLQSLINEAIANNHDLQ